MYALTKIKGVGRRYSNLVCKKVKRHYIRYFSMYSQLWQADVDLNKRAGELTSEELERVVSKSKSSISLDVANILEPSSKIRRNTSKYRHYNALIDMLMRTTHQNSEVYVELLGMAVKTYH